MTLEELSAYLASDDSPENCMMLSDLDGFIHGIACSPVSIPAEEWVTVAMGGSPEAVPRAVLEGVVDRYVDVLEALVSEPPEVAPVFWETHDGHVIAKDWCEGFVRAVGLRPRAWVSLTKSGSHAALMTPILSHLLDEERDVLLGISRQERASASGATAEDLPAAVLGIHQFWSR